MKPHPLPKLVALFLLPIFSLYATQTQDVPTKEQTQQEQTQEETKPKKLNFTKWLNPIEVLSQGTRTLEDTFLVITGAVPKSAQTAQEIFSEGVIYSRLRTNMFGWEYKEPEDMDHYGLGIGGKLMFVSAPFMGFNGVVAFHYSDAPFKALRENDQADIENLRAVQDTFNRFKVYNKRDYSMASLTQLNLNYELFGVKATGGRLLYESMLTSANDTKMIPNAFEGGVLEYNGIINSSWRAAYFSAQKLRDHEKFHDVITYGDGSNHPKAIWKNNDDSAIHKGLSYTNLENAGKKTKNSLVVLDLKNDTVENLRLDLAYTAVPGLISSVAGEINYKLPLVAGFTLTPGYRFMRQMDNGAGEIGGATLSGALAVDQNPSSNLGYKNRYSLGGGAHLARLLLQRGHFSTQIAYSHVLDEADLVTPWRGFITNGYTRAMGQYNWNANTKSTAIRFIYDFSSSNLIPGFSAITRYVVQDFDESKQVAGGQADSNVLHIDMRQELLEGFDAKLRMAFVDAQKRQEDALVRPDSFRDSYNEYRFELNYLF